MKFYSLDMVWPAMYVAEEVYKFWFLIFGTIVIELFTIRCIAKFSWKKSFIASIIGNLTSGLAGTFIMTFVMLFWHLLFDWMLPQSTFDIVNWFATYLLMCFGSVVIETFVVKTIFKSEFKKLFLAMLIGNFLSYSFIAIIMIKKQKDSEISRTEKLIYLPNKNHFVLLDNSTLEIYNSYISINYNRKGERLNEIHSAGYFLHIPFKKQFKDSFQFELRQINEVDAGGIDENYKDIDVEKFEDQFVILLEQKNTDSTLGWQKPIITDTLFFKKSKSGSR